MKKIITLSLSICGIVARLNAQTIADTLNNMAANSWYTLSNSAMTPVLYPSVFGDGIHLNQGPAAVTHAWSGGAYDKINHRLFIWGGGHFDYGGNEVYVFHTDSFKWERRTQPSSGSIAAVENADPLSDGKPFSRHTRGYMTFIEHADKLFSCGGINSNITAESNLTWLFDYSTKTWINKLPSGTIPDAYNSNTSASAYDSISKKVIYTSTNGLFIYDYTTNNWMKSAKSIPQIQPSTKMSCIVPNKRLYFLIGAGQFFAYNIQKDSIENWAFQPNQASSIGKCSGLAYDSKANQLLAITQDSLWALNLNTKIWSKKTYSVPSSSYLGVEGPFGRWQYLPEYNVFMLVANTSDNVHFYKNTSGPGSSVINVPTKNSKNVLDEGMNMKIFPNPFDNTATIQLSPSLDLKNASLKIYDLLGKIVIDLTEKLNQKTMVINTEFLPPGYYMLKLYTETKVYTSKINKINN